MHHRAGRAIRKVLEGDVDEAVRNDAAFRLATIHFQKGQFAEAQHALDRIQGRIPPEIRDGIEFLRANIDLAIGHPSNAVEVLKQLQGSERLGGFVAYNLGIAYCRTDTAGCDRSVGEVRTNQGRRSGRPAIRDKSNLVLGTILYESADFGARNRSIASASTDRFEPGTAAPAGPTSASVRPSPRALEHPRCARADRRRRAGSHARRPARIRKAQ
jgi:tetratricopeptide (TPR) repeat protein